VYTSVYHKTCFFFPKQYSHDMYDFYLVFKRKLLFFFFEKTVKDRVFFEIFSNKLNFSIFVLDIVMKRVLSYIDSIKRYCPSIRFNPLKNVRGKRRTPKEYLWTRNVYLSFRRHATNKTNRFTRYDSRDRIDLATDHRQPSNYIVPVYGFSTNPNYRHSRRARRSRTGRDESDLLSSRIRSFDYTERVLLCTLQWRNSFVEVINNNGRTREKR